MYRSLCNRGSFTEYVYVPITDFKVVIRLNPTSPLPTAFFLFFSPRPSDPTGFSPTVPIPAAQCREVSGPIHFAPVTQSEGARTTYDTPVSLPADHIQVTIIPGGSTSNLVHENTKDKADSDSTGYESV